MASFDERARDWDTPVRIARAAAVADAIRSAVALAGTERLIDVGAGTGLLGLALVDDVASVTLADPSAGMIEVATEKLAGGDLPSVHAVQHDLIADPPPAEPFDLAVSLLVLHHIEDTAAALAAIHALLAPGGRIALVDLDTEDGTFHSAEAEGIYYRGFERREVERLAAEAGFVDVATRTAMVIEDEDGGGPGFPAFLLTGRRGPSSP
jgi:2-polyprenyl-3-methyl-5-hydroxy-6-metoxy-1,4-benzoquinol methylase